MKFLLKEIFKFICVLEKEIFPISSFRFSVSDKVLSNHSSGTAIDLNAIKHPLGKSNTFNKDQRNMINLLITKYGLAWGGNYKKRKDDMHFEIALDQKQVQLKIKELGLE